MNAFLDMHFSLSLLYSLTQFRVQCSRGILSWVSVLDSLPCLLCLMCLKDTCTLEEKMLKDPRRLYAPGRLYHIVERKPLRYNLVHIEHYTPKHSLNYYEALS